MSAMDMFEAVRSTGLADLAVAARLVSNLPEAGPALRAAAREELAAAAALNAARERLWAARRRVSDLLDGRFSDEEVTEAACEAGWWPRERS